MAIRIDPIDETSQGPIHLIIAGYRSRPCTRSIQAANLEGAAYGVRWAAGRWAEAGASVGWMTRAAQIGFPALRTGRVLVGVTSLATGVGGAVALGVGQFRHRYWCAQRDGMRLAAAIAEIPGIRHRPIHLHGHSLGTVVIRAALPELLARDYRVEDVLLMGGVAPRLGWHELAETFVGRLINLYSPKDRILNVAPVVCRVVGTGGIESGAGSPSSSDSWWRRVMNHDVCSHLPSPFQPIRHHSGYWRCFSRFVIPGC